MRNRAASTGSTLVLALLIALAVTRVFGVWGLMEQAKPGAGQRVAGRQQGGR